MRTLKIMALGLAVLVFSGVALHADSLYLGPNDVSVKMYVFGSYQTEGGGSIGPSLLGPTQGTAVSVPWVYCIDLKDSITIPGWYNNTTVTNDASMTGLTNDSSGLTGFNNGSGVVNNAAQVAYLLQTYAAGATTGDQQAALQAAIWTEIYGSSNVYINETGNRLTLYNTYLTNVGTGNVANFSWLSPGNGLQGLVTQVPDGGMTLILLGGTLVGVETLRRKFRV